MSNLTEPPKLSRFNVSLINNLDWIDTRFLNIKANMSKTDMKPSPPTSIKSIIMVWPIGFRTSEMLIGVRPVTQTADVATNKASM